MTTEIRNGPGAFLSALIATTIVAGPVWGQAIPQKNVNVIGPTPINWLLAGNPRMQQNEPECAVSPNNPEWLACGFNDYRAVNDPAIGDAFPGIAMSRDSGRTWSSGLHPGHLGDIPTINKKFGADANLEALPNLLLYNFIAGWRDDSFPGGVFLSRWYEHNREVGPPWEHLDTIEVDMGTSGRFLDKPAFDVAAYATGLQPPIQIPIPAFNDPRNPANSHPAYTLSVPAARAHLCYAIFVGNDNNDGTKINCLASDDGGQTWPVRSKITEGVEINQGVSIATRNDGQDVLAVWRRFSDNNETSAIMYAFSTNWGNTWSKAEVLTEFCAFDQTTGAARFRTNALPVAVSNGSDFAVYFAARNNATETCFTPAKGNKPAEPRMSPVAPENDFDGPDDGEIRTALNFARIMMVRGSGNNKLNWTTPVMIDPQLVGGGSNPDAARKPSHQFMPAVEAAGGIETVSWFDSRFDKLNALATPINSGFVEDAVLHIDFDAVPKSGTVLPSGIYDLVPPPPTLPPAEGNFPLRRNIDTFAAQIVNGNPIQYKVNADFYPDASGSLNNSVRVSRFASRQKEGAAPGVREQLEFNYPNGRLFRKGRAPFIGDYNTVAAAQFRQLQDGTWVSNQTPISSTPTALFSSAQPVFHVGWTSNHNVRGRVFYTGCDVWDEALQMWVASPTGCASSYEDPTGMPGMMIPLQGEDGSADGPPGVCQAVPPGQKKPQPLTRNQNIFVAAMKPGINVDVVSAIKLPDGIGFNTFVLEILNGTPAGSRVRLELPLDDPAVSFRLDGPLTEIQVDVPRGSGNARTVFDTANIIDDDPPPSSSVIVEVFDVTGLSATDAATRGTGVKVSRVALLRESLAPLENVQNNDPDDPKDIIDPSDGEFYDIILKREIGTTQSLDLENLDLENTIYMLDLENLDLENLDLENTVLFLDLENLDLENIDLSNIDLKNALYEQLDLENLDLENLDLENLDLENLDLENRNLFYLDLENLDLENNVFEQLDLENLDLENLDLENLDLENLDLENLDLENFSIYASDLENLDLENLDLENTAPGDEYTEISWTADSATNTTTGVDIKPIFTESLAAQLTAAGSDTKVLLTVRQPYLTGTVLTNQAGAAPGVFCTPQVVAENQLVYAAILTPAQINSLFDDPDPADPTTPGFILQPDGSKIITLRVINPPAGLTIEDISRNTGIALYTQPGSNSCVPELGSEDEDVLNCEIDFIVDNDPPVITLNGDTEIDVEADPDPYVDPGATAVDDVDGSVPVTMSDNVDKTMLGEYSVTFTATDAAGNVATATRTVNVVDTTAPDLSVPADITMEATAPLTPVNIGTASATDFIGPIAIGNDAPAGGFAVATTDVIWTATDGEGNQSTAIQRITVTDTTPPTLVVLGDNPLTLEATILPYNDPGATAIDLVNGDLTGAILVTSTVNPAVVGNYSVEYSVADALGNAASISRIVTVVDTVDPVILFNPPAPDFDPPLPVLQPGEVTTFPVSWVIDGEDLAAGLSISCEVDNPLLTETITPQSTSYANGILQATFEYNFQVGTSSLTCTITDQGGNTDTSDPFLVLVEDVPEISVLSDTLTLPAADGSFATVSNAELAANIVATDRIDGNLSAAVSCLASDPTEFDIGEYPIDCSVTDSGGNTATASFTLEVVFPYDIVIEKLKGNIRAGSTVPVDWYYVEPGTNNRVDTSAFSPSVAWFGRFGNQCAEPSSGDGDGAEDSGSSDIRYSPSDDSWRLNWQTPPMSGWYKLVISPPGTEMATECVRLR